MWPPLGWGYRSGVATLTAARGRINALACPFHDPARARDHLAVVAHQDRHRPLTAEALDLGPVLRAARPRPELQAPALDGAVLVRMARVVERFGRAPARVRDRTRQAAERLPHLARVEH